MVYKYKNNKWSRMIAARKLAAANRKREAAGQAAGATTVAKSGTSDVTEITGAAQMHNLSEGHNDTAKTNDTSAQKTPKTSKQSTDSVSNTTLTVESGAMQQLPPTTTTYEVIVNDSAENARSAILIAPIEHNSPSTLPSNDAQPFSSTNGSFSRNVEMSNRQSNDVQVPHVIDAYYVPSHCIGPLAVDSTTATSDATSLSNYVAYVLQTVESGADSVCTTLTAFGVCDARPGGSCLQVVHFNSPPLSAHTTPGKAASDTIFSELSSEKAVMMYVDADGQCFMLAPSSVVAVEQVELTSGAGKEDVVLKGSEKSQPFAFWLIPSCLKHHFLALLWWQRQRQASRGTVMKPIKDKSIFVPDGQLTSSNAAVSRSFSPSFEVRLHPTRWQDLETTPVHGTGVLPSNEKILQAAASKEDSELPPAALKTVMKGKNKGKAIKRGRYATPPSAPVANKADLAPPITDASAAPRIPYVAAVTGLTAALNHGSTTAGADASPLPKLNSYNLPPSTVFHVGNLLKPFPADYVF